MQPTSVDKQPSAETPDQGQPLVGKVFVARQPIFDRSQKVYGYELLFRSSPFSQVYDGGDGSEATSEVMANTMFAEGMESILGGKRGFFNFTRELLVGGVAHALPSASTVVEILETVQADRGVIEACQRLKAGGYTVALDDVIPGKLYSPLAKYADIIKVDFQQTNLAEQRRMVERFRRSGAKLLAEKVETAGEFLTAREQGYTYFQGYFFAHPEIVAGRQPPAFKAHYHKLLRAINRPNLEFNEIEDIIKQELSLVYKLLRYINSARFYWLSQVNSIRHAIVLLGAQEVRTWVSLALVSGMGEDKPSELVTTGMIRARFCEVVGTTARMESRKDSLFLMGMFSVMDAIMDAPLAEALGEIQLDRDVLEALLGFGDEKSRVAAVYGTVRAYEVGDWEKVSEHSAALGIDEALLPRLYAESVRWVEQIFAKEA